MAKVFLICGKICSGKTTYAHKLCNANEAHLLSVDEVTLNTCDATRSSDHNKQAMIIKRELLKKSADIIAKGKSIVLDWGFWTKAERESVKVYYNDRAIQNELHYIHINDDLWDKRIKERNAAALSKDVVAYFVDTGLKDKCRNLFEEPEEKEIDVKIYM